MKGEVGKKTSKKDMYKLSFLWRHKAYFFETLCPAVLFRSFVYLEGKIGIEYNIITFDSVALKSKLNYNRKKVNPKNLFVIKIVSKIKYYENVQKHRIKQISLRLK